MIEKARSAMKIFRIVFFANFLLNSPWSHATSFDCNKGRSTAEQMICRTTDLSKLDDVLGKLYWQALHTVANPKTFRADSDSKWIWREANCTDLVCLRNWYTGRIEELQRLLVSPQPGKPDGGATQLYDAPRDTAARHTAERNNTGRSELTQTRVSTTALQCTAADPDIEPGDECTAVMKENAGWRSPLPHGDWFCALAMLPKTVR